MERTYKTWGEKWVVFANDLCEVSILYLKDNQRCSWHKHQCKYNQFFVIAGDLWIKMEDGTAHLTKGQIFTTRPGEWHEFQTHDGRCVVQEIMYVKYDSEDIERDKVGGPMENEFVYVCPKCGIAAIKCSDGDYLCRGLNCHFLGPRENFLKRSTRA